MRATTSLDRLSGGFRPKKTLLRPLGDYLRRVLAPRVPPWIAPWQLTAITLPLTGITVLLAWLAGSNPQWLWGVSALVVIQYVADVLDGELGRRRGAGLVLWGFYVDHLLDALFISAAIAAYLPVYPEATPVLVGIIVVTNALFLHEALACVCTGSYNSYGHHGMGLEEGRALIVLVNAVVALQRPDWVVWVFVATLALLGTILLEQLFVTQRSLWERDMQARGGHTPPPAGEADLEAVGHPSQAPHG